MPRKKGDGTGVRQTDYTDAEQLYVTTTMPLREVAQKLGLKSTALQSVCTRRGWMKKRTEYQEQIAREAREKTHTERVEHLASLMRSTLRLSDVVADALDDPDQLRRWLVQESDGERTETVERVYDKIDSRAVRDLAAAQRDLARTIRDVFRLPTQGEEHAQQLARERLELDKRKADADMGTDKTITVVLDGAGLEGYSE